ncbi:hypothetical protein NE865_11184 [Phthorimaea operculella]|nr:hypothetical protein NE865_11184 [Phthorimaea operculella]
MENINLFLLRLILTAVVLNVVAAKKAKETTVTQRTQDSSEVSSRDHKQHDHDFYFKPTLEHIDGTARKHRKNMETPMKHGKHIDQTSNKHGKKSKKAKRETYGRWSARSLNSGYNSVEYSGSLPLYLVFNRKVGAYYPFYKYPKESQRRSGNYRRVPLD